MRVSKKTHNQCKQIATGGYRSAKESSFLTLDVIIISEEITNIIKERK